VIDSPTPIDGEEGVGVPAVNSELVVTVDDAAEIFVSGVVALSFTLSSKVYEVLAVRVSPGIVHVSVAPPVAPLPLADAPHWVAFAYPLPVATSHCQE
jgi:hypothetical protein